MKPTIKNIVVLSLTLLLTTFLVTSYVKAEMNPFEWEERVRTAQTLFWIMGTVVITIFLFAVEDYKS